MLSKGVLLHNMRADAANSGAADQPTVQEGSAQPESKQQAATNTPASDASPDNTAALVKLIVFSVALAAVPLGLFWLSEAGRFNGESYSPCCPTVRSVRWMQSGSV